MFQLHSGQVGWSITALSTQFRSYRAVKVERYSLWPNNHINMLVFNTCPVTWQLVSNQRCLEDCSQAKKRNTYQGTAGTVHQVIIQNHCYINMNGGQDMSSAYVCSTLTLNKYYSVGSILIYIYR